MPEQENIAEKLDTIAQELEKTLAHCRTAAAHFRNKEVPRGCAHIVALQGHLAHYETLMKEIITIHASRATP